MPRCGMTASWFMLAVRIGGLRIGTPALGAVVGALCILVAILAAALVVIAGARRLRRRGQPDPVARAAMLRRLGYEPSGGDRWIRPLPGLPLTFEDSGDGLRWTGRLPRYGTLHLVIEEREGKGLGTLSSDSFLTQDSEFDERFVVRSDRPSQTLNLLADQAVGDLLLAMPFVHLELRADEIVVSDPQCRGLHELCGGPVAIATPRGLRGERELHGRVTQLCLAVVTALPRQA